MPIFNYDKESCWKPTEFGPEYQSLTCLYPNTLGKVTTEWENNYDPTDVFFWMRRNPIAPPAILVSLYIVFVFYGPVYMKDKEPFNWRKALAVWNFLLSSFSIMGFLRVLPQFIHNLATKSFEENMCGVPTTLFGAGSTGLWVMLFILSKIPELIDTVFLVVHKKPVIFLHWYHHVTVLLYCWHSYVVNTTTGIWFCVMNYAVHGIMYFYYFLMAVKMRPKWFNPMWITYAQISQMFFGVTITAIAYCYKSFDVDNSCAVDPGNNMAAVVMYGSYLALFLQFFFRRYFKTKVQKKKVV